MTETEPEARNGLVLPLTELLAAVAKFGNDFDGDGDQQHLREALTNIQTLKYRALGCVRDVGVLVEAAALHELNAVTPGAGTTVWFLAEIVEEMDSLEQKVVTALRRNSAAATT